LQRFAGDGNRPCGGVRGDARQGGLVSGFAAKVADSGRALARVFSNPGLRRLQLAFVGSIVGDWAYATAVAVYAFGQGGAAAVGLLGVVRYLSMAAVLPLASTLADRYPRKRVMIASDLLRAVLVFAAAGSIASGGPVLVVYALAIVTALAGTPFRPSQAALLPALARDAGELTAANVASSTIESVGFFAGPALGGLLLAVANVQTVYVVNAVTFLWSAAIVAGLRVPARVREEEGADEPRRESLLAHAGAGFRAIASNRDIRLIVGVYCAQTVVAGASLVFVVAVALDLLDLNASGVGYLNAMMGIGGLVGGFVALVLAQRGRLALDFGLGVILWSAPLLAVAAWPAAGVAAAAMALIGLGNSLVDINAYTILQRTVPDEVLGRVFGAMESAVIGAMALGALVMPLLIHSIGIRAGLAVLGGAVAALVVVALPGLRRVDLTALAPPGLELLRRITIFALLPEPIIERLARALVPVEASAGEVVIHEGDEGDRFYAIEEGTVVVTKEGRWIADLGPGDYFGEIALLQNVLRTATVTAKTDVLLQALEREVFIPAVTGHHDFEELAETAMATRLAML
jgi:MFS family permease